VGLIGETASVGHANGFLLPECPESKNKKGGNEEGSNGGKAKRETKAKTVSWLMKAIGQSGDWVKRKRGQTQLYIRNLEGENKFQKKKGVFGVKYKTGFEWGGGGGRLWKSWGEIGSKVRKVGGENLLQERSDGV